MQNTAQSLSPKQHTKQELAWIKHQIHNRLGFQKSSAILIVQCSCLVAKGKENLFEIYSKFHIKKKKVGKKRCENKILVLFFFYTNMAFFT